MTDTDTTQQESRTVTTRRGTDVNLVDVERDDEQAIIGTTGTGKRFVGRADRLGARALEFEDHDGELPAGRHPYRVYLNQLDEPLRVLDPPFEAAETFYLDVHEGQQPTATITFVLEDRRKVTVEHDDIGTLLSARPEDQAAAEARAN